MKAFFQGDVIKVNGFARKHFVVVSKNAFISATGVMHVCPMLNDMPDGPLHINVKAKKSVSGAVICEQIKLIDPHARNCIRVDSLNYEDIMNISDAIQGMFEYD